MQKLNPLSIAFVGLALACSVANAQPMKPCDLMKMMMSDDQDVVKQGIDGFVSLGKMGAVPLVCFISGQAPGAPVATEQGKSNAEKALVKIGSAAVPAIIERLGSSDEEFRTRLVRVLGQIRDPRITQPLMNLWKSEKSDRVRRMLVGSLARVLKPGALLPLLRERIPAAGPQELRALAGQLALQARTIDLGKVIARIPTDKLKQFVQDVVSDLKAIGGNSAAAAIQRLETLTGRD
ncbi:MAG: HEAT repeat domain-containing protein [Armatimonadetes bacterium]|nr:HEAT repeat domain-containing protein [Armatimonadota bacterium]